jgi:hypothetical protein
MTKGKPWDINEVRQLRELIDDGKSVEEISKIMVKTQDAIKQKMFDLKLKEKRVGVSRKTVFSSSKLELPSELPTVEETLQILASALRKGAEAGLDKDEVQRLQVVATLAKTYKELFADYLDYRSLEQRLIELEAKYAELVKSQKPTAPATA